MPIYEFDIVARTSPWDGDTEASGFFHFVTVTVPHSLLLLCNPILFALFGPPTVDLLLRIFLCDARFIYSPLLLSHPSLILKPHEKSLPLLTSPSPLLTSSSLPISFLTAFLSPIHCIEPCLTGPQIVIYRLTNAIMR